MNTVRCAIYTRKSSEDGLEQDFNSLDAQREACAAYILSQASEGWKLLPELYDDGGLSGGTLERPALQQLMDDVKAGRIDIIVVYKVDRLTRSLLDFAKLVEAYDAADVSFVSVTQSFNTTTSMGRLTLNMLLSFAQFEREVTAERIRDKIAASKARGMWMGGNPPLGYKPDGRSLMIIAEHAEIIREIYQLYLAQKNVRRVAESLALMGTLTPIRTTATGKTYGGRRFSRGQLYSILKNPIYTGNIGHKGTIYPGNHEPIISQDIWEAVQRQLKANAQGTRTQREKSRALLAGLIFDEGGRPLKHVHTTKGSKRYRYYVVGPNECGGGADKLRIPALEIERLVLEELQCLLDDPLSLAGKIRLDLRPSALAKWEALKDVEFDKKTIVRRFLTKVSVHAERIVLTLDTQAIAERLGGSDCSTSTETIDHPISVRVKRSGLALKLISPDGAYAIGSAPDAALVQLIVQAREWWAQLGSGQRDIASLAQEEGVSASWMTRVVRLAFLSPCVVEAILVGRMRAGISSKTLLGSDGVSADWEKQYARLVASA